MVFQHSLTGTPLDKTDRKSARVPCRSFEILVLRAPGGHLGSLAWVRKTEGSILPFGLVDQQPRPVVQRPVLCQQARPKGSLHPSIL